MTTFETVVKYCAIALAILLIVAIFCGIIAIVANLAVWFGGASTSPFGNAVDENNTYVVTQDINELDIEISAAALDIVYADEFRVESNLKYIKVTDNGRCLKVSETKRFSVHTDKIYIKVYIPRDASFYKADISTGAGKVKIEALKTERLSLDIGAGDVEIDMLAVSKSADIEAGTGRLAVDKGTLANADIELGVGEVSITSAFSGRCDIDSGIGNTDITIIGNNDDYKFDVNSGIGKVTVGGQIISGDSKFGNGTNIINLDCGIGNVNVNFEKPQE